MVPFFLKGNNYIKTKNGKHNTIHGTPTQLKRHLTVRGARETKNNKTKRTNSDPNSGDKKTKHKIQHIYKRDEHRSTRYKRNAMKPGPPIF